MPKNKTDDGGPTTEVSHDDIVYNNTIYRYYGNSNPPSIKHRTSKGGWTRTAKETTQNKAEVDQYWKSLFEMRDTTKKAVSNGSTLKIVDVAEAVTPMPIARKEQNATTVAFSLDFESLAAHMDYRYEILTNPSKAQSRALVELGFLILIAKRELLHGQLTDWIKTKTKVSNSWSAYARRSAEQFVEQNGEESLLLLCNPSAEADQTDRVLAEQQMMDFTGGKGPSALLDALGIKKRSDKEPVEQIPEGETREHLVAKSTWENLNEMLAESGLHEESWAHLTPNEREGLYATIHELDTRLSASLKGGK